jgi:hypothetical protein
MSVLKLSHDVMPRGGGEAGCGFNSRIHGKSHREATANIPHGLRYSAYSAGWELADKMIREGKLYYVHNFHNSHECSGHAFPYGGKFVCETCTFPGGPTLEKPWWTIKCYPDGNAWCCVGADFEDLQASDCFAFGDTREEAIKNYGDIYATKAPTTEVSA